MLANAIVSRHLGYCNSMLYGVNKVSLAKFQKVLNTLCSIVYRLVRMRCVTLYPEKLHWLSIPYCILFNYKSLTFKAKNFSQPPHLSSFIKSSSLTHGIGLSVSSIHPKKATGRCGLTTAAPFERNSFSLIFKSQQAISSFRSHLITHLF